MDSGGGYRIPLLPSLLLLTPEGMGEGGVCSTQYGDRRSMDGESGVPKGRGDLYRKEGVSGVLGRTHSTLDELTTVRDR